MRIRAWWVLIFILIQSCKSDEALVGNIKSLQIIPAKRAVLNVGSHFSYSILATLKDGTQQKIKTDSLISFPSDDLISVGEYQARIEQPLSSFNDNFIPVDIQFTSGNYTFRETDSLVLNFKGAIIAHWNGDHGKNGMQPRASGATLFGRDGLEGKPGGKGSNGGPGKNLTGYMWLANEYLRLVLYCDSTSSSYYYKSIHKEQVRIFLNGGNGGNGAQGGNGGDGKKGKTGKLPGSGGDGGPGGDGGQGGKGGSLLLFVHPNAAHLTESVHLFNSGGNGGAPGEGGSPGKGGTATKDQDPGIDGEKGPVGTSGKKGEDGPSITISVVPFDTTVIEKGID
jgi:hypothetical protein